jgi:hypothetical protein
MDKPSIRQIRRRTKISHGHQFLNTAVWGAAAAIPLLAEVNSRHHMVFVRNACGASLCERSHRSARPAASLLSFLHHAAQDFDTT